MDLRRKLGFSVTGVALLAGATAGLARPQGSLVLTPRSDAQPYFVPPVQERHVDPADEAIDKFRHAMAAAAMVQQQKIAAECRTEQPQAQSPEQRWAWAASCRYARR